MIRQAFQIPKSILIIILVLFTSTVEAKSTTADGAKRDSETKIRNLIEPLLDKYCRDQCKLLGVNVAIDMVKPDALSPGFEDTSSYRSDELEPTSAKLKLLIDDKVGP